jgi:hypothetical protein
MNEFKKPENMFETALAKMIRNNEKKIEESMKDNDNLNEIKQKKDSIDIINIKNKDSIDIINIKNNDNTNKITSNIKQNNKNDKKNGMKNTNNFADITKRINANQVDNDVVMKCLSERLLFLFYFHFSFYLFFKTY